MLGRELRTPAALVFGKPPDVVDPTVGPEYARKLQDRLEAAHRFAREQQQSACVKQKRSYDVCVQGRHFVPGELVWVYSPQCKKGRCPKQDSLWVEPCKVLERLGEIVYRVQMSGRGRKVALHRDRLAPYRGSASFPTQRVPAAPDLAAPSRSPQPPVPSPPSARPVTVPPAPPA